MEEVDYQKLPKAIEDYYQLHSPDYYARGSLQDIVDSTFRNPPELVEWYRFHVDLFRRVIHHKITSQKYQQVDKIIKESKLKVERLHQEQEKVNENLSPDQLDGTTNLYLYVKELDIITVKAQGMLNKLEEQKKEIENGLKLEYEVINRVGYLCVELKRRFEEKYIH